MTANELADELENRESHWKLINYIHWAEQAVTMLRQQQAEIEALKLRELTDEEIVNLYKETEADNGGIREFARAILQKASEK